VNGAKKGNIDIGRGYKRGKILAATRQQERTLILVTHDKGCGVKDWVTTGTKVLVRSPVIEGTGLHGSQ
jgi:hypothetical protein